MRFVVALSISLIGASAFAQTPLPRPRPSVHPPRSLTPLPRPRPLAVAPQSATGMPQIAHASPTSSERAASTPTHANVPLPHARPTQPEPRVAITVEPARTDAPPPSSIVAAPLPRVRPTHAPTRATAPSDVVRAEPVFPPVQGLDFDEKPAPASPIVANHLPVPKMRPSAAARQAGQPAEVAHAEPVPSPPPPPMQGLDLDEKPASAAPKIADVPVPRMRPSAAAPRQAEQPAEVARARPVPSPPPPPMQGLDLDEKPASAASKIADVPVPRMRPSAAAPRPAEQPAEVAHAEPVPSPPPMQGLDLDEKPASAPPKIADVPVPKTRPAAAAPHAAEQPADIVHVEPPAPTSDTDRNVAVVPLPAARPAQAAPSAEVETPQPVEPAIAAAPLPRERPSGLRPPGRFTFEELRKIYEQGLRAAESEPAERFRGPALPPDAVIESPSAAVPAETARAEPTPQGASPTTEPAPQQTAELPALSPLVPSVSALPMPVILRIPTPRRRPGDAMPRLFDAVFHELRVTSPGNECSVLMSSGVIVAERLPGIGRGACHVPDAVRVESIVMPDRRHVDFVPPATMRCTMALEIANWIRGDVAAAARVFKSPIVGIRDYDSYNCRHMSSSRRMLSEHGKGNALDINSLLLASGQKVELTDRRVFRIFRHDVKLAACKRFKTVLGPGVPAHNDHIHVDLRKHYGPGGICHWNVL